MKTSKVIFWSCYFVGLITYFVTAAYTLLTGECYSNSSVAAFFAVVVLVILAALIVQSAISSPYFFFRNSFRIGYMYKLIAKEKKEETRVLTFRCLNDGQTVTICMDQMDQNTWTVGELNPEKCYVVLFSGKISLVSGTKMYLSELQI